MKEYYFYIMVMLAPCISRSQNSVMYPDFFSSYQQNKSFVNVAYIPENVRADFTGAYRFQTGPFKQISTLAFSGAKIVKTQNNANHVIRLLLYNEKQGPFFSNPRAYLNYGFKLSLSTNLKLSSGLAAGFTEKFYSGVSASGNSNVFLPDASAGLMITYKKLNVGVCGLQLLNSAAPSLSSDIVYKRYYQFYADHDWSISNLLKLKSHALYRLLPSARDEWFSGLSFYINDRVGLGTVFRSNYELSFIINLTFGSDSENVNIFFNYNSPFLSPYYYTKSSIELGVGYSLF